MEEQTNSQFGVSQVSQATDIKLSYTPHIIKKYIGEDTNQPIYSRHKRHVFVMTKMARPIYVRYGDEIDLSPFLATLNTIIEKFITYYLNDKQRSVFQKVYNNGNEVIYVLVQKELYLICKTHKDDSEILVKSMLEFLNIQIISITTDMVNKRLQKKANYDFRNMLGGTAVNLGLAIKNGLTSPSILLRSYMVTPMPSTLRSSIHYILKEYKSQESFQCVLVLTHTHIIDTWYQKDFMKLQAQDIILIQSLLQAQSSFRQSDNWIPVCLPGVAAEGFLYLFLAYISKDVVICMISDDNNSFDDCKQAYKILQDKFQKENIVDQLNSQLKLVPYKMPFEKTPSIKHFIVQIPHLDEFSMPQFNTFGKQSDQFKYFLNRYANLYQKYHQMDEEDKKEFLSFQKNKNYVEGIYSNSQTVVLFIFDRFCNIQEINQNINIILKWQKEEESKYFITKFQ